MKKSLSVVTTLYKSEIFLQEFLDEILNALEVINPEKFELIFVNDGSPDCSVDFLLEKRMVIKEIKIIDLSRNFGHHQALLAGLSQAKYDLIFTIDSDLEVSPSMLVEFYDKHQNDLNIDVVYGFQEIRKGSGLEKIGGLIFWKILNYLSPVKVPNNILTERLMTREVVDAILSLGDKNIFIGGMMHWVGFNQVGIPVKKGVRKGNSTYSLSKRVDLMVDAITSFTSKPLVYMFKFGIIISILSLSSFFCMIFYKLKYGNQIQLGWASLMSVNLLVLGILSTFIGFLGIYISKIFKQVQNRPNYLVRKIYE